MPTSDTLLLEIIKSYTRNIHSIILNKKTYSVFLLTLFFTLTPNLSAKPAKRINVKILVDTTKLQENIDSAVKIDTTLKTNVLLDNLTKLQITDPSKVESLMSKGSSKEKLKSDVKKLVTKEIEQSKVSFLSHKELIEQSKDFVVIYNQSVQAKSFIKEGFDYRTTLENMKKFTRMREMATDGVSNNRDKLQTSRNLTTTTILLHEILKKTNNIMSNVLAYHRDLGRLQFKLDSLVNNSTIYKVPADSAALKSYLQKIYFLKSNLDPVNASIVTALDSIQQLEVQVDIFRLNLESDLALTESTRENMVSHYWTDEISKLDKKTLAEQTFNANLKYSLFKAILVFMFYTYNHAEKFGIMLISFIFVLIYLQLLLKRCIKTNVFDKLSGYTEILKYPIASSLLLTITVMQFFLPDPPIVFDALIWIISSLLFSYILWKTVDRFWFKVWLIYILLFAMTLFDNLILRYSHPEQNFMFVISTISIIVGSYLLIRIKHQKITEKAMVIPLAIMLVFELIALYFNFTGSYNMAKTTMSNGIFIFVLVYILLWCARLVMEAMNISIYFQKNMNDETHQIPVDIFTKKIPISLHLLLVLAAIFLTYRTSYTFQSIIDPIIAAYSATRSIGKFSFTYESVFIFFFVMYLSSIISKIVSFLTAGSALYSKNKKDSGPGSWLLLIKIGIIGTGVVLAFVAAGIPMDRLAIIISALGVGIGFGLQTLINNLVSGLIIAFEKPINVGDFVEIAGQSGKMKSIGIRSSIVTTWDGADVVIPNGDLMNQHLTNWTMGNTRKRYEIKLGVAYGSDLELTQTILLQLFKSDDRIMKNPEPFVIITEFNNSSIDFAIKFWVYHYELGFDVKSDLIIAIDKALKENNIEIPFPQQDIHFKSDLKIDEKKDIKSTKKTKTAKDQ